MLGRMIVVAVALVDESGRLLVQQRPADKAMGGLWEFPGGKVEDGETPEAALTRELAEELDIAIAAADLTPTVFASEPLASKHMILLLYICRVWQGEPRPLAAEALKWVRPAELHDLAMPPADTPLIALLEQLL